MDVMLDLETMGKGPNAAIVAIGAVEMDFETGKLGREFYRVVDLRTSVLDGGVMDADTVMWWLDQSESARAALKQGEELWKVLHHFAIWLEERPRSVKVWGNGAEFDNVILSQAYKHVEKETPWKYYNNRCYRTVKNLFPKIELERTGTHHNALDDAKSQADHLLGIIGSLGG